MFIFQLLYFGSVASFITFLKLIALVAAWTTDTCGPYLPCPRSLECNAHLQVCESQSGQQTGRLRVIKAESNSKISISPDKRYLLAVQPLQLRTYLKISISLCAHNSSWESTPLFFKSAVANFYQNDISHRLEAYNRQVNGDCSLYTFEQIAFLQLYEGQAQNLLIEINSKQEQSQLSITVAQERYENVYALYHFGNIALTITAILSFFLLIWIKYGSNQGDRGSQGQILMEDSLGSQLDYFDLYLPRRKFNELSIHDNICPICLIAMQDHDIVRQTPCLHVFHVVCLDSWCASRKMCPICRCSLTKTHILSLIDKEEMKEEADNPPRTRSVELKVYRDKGMLQEML